MVNDADSGRASAFDRLRHQPTLQIVKRDTGADYVETLQLESGAVTSSAGAPYQLDRRR